MTHPRDAATQTPDKPAMIMADTGEAMSYAELEALANQGAHALRRLGIQTGDTIAIWLENCLEYLVIFWAAQRAGLYITPLAVQLTADEAAYILQDNDAKLLVTSEIIGGARRLATELRGDLPKLGTIATVGEGIAECPEWRALIAQEPSTPIADEQAGRHFVYSSGTTGRPKGVRMPLTGAAPTDPDPITERQRHLYALGSDTVYLSPAPLYHTAPLFFSSAIQRMGGTVIILRKFDPEAALAAIEQYRVTFSQMVPTMFLRMLRLPDDVRRKYDLSSLQGIVHAAAPCPVDTKRAMIDWLGPIIWEYYSGSEGAGSTVIDSHEWLRKPGSVGRASLGTVHITDFDGNELKPGETGQIYFEGGARFEYHNDPKKTAEARHPKFDGWSSLGDIGYLDEDGYLFLTDRKSFMIISGGVNIYPQEAENVLSTHPRVLDVAVIGVPDPNMGEAVKAVVVPADPSDAGEAFAQELIAYCRARLSPIKCPRSVDFAASLPREDTGKLYKRQIRDRYWQGHSTHIL